MRSVVTLVVVLLTLFRASAVQAQSQRFVDQPGDIVWDKQLNAFWLKKPLRGQNAVNANKYANDTRITDRRGWRLPTVAELQTLSDASREPYAIVPEILLDGSSVWTSEMVLGANRFKHVTYDFNVKTPNDKRRVATDYEGYRDGQTQSDHPRTLLIRSRFWVQLEVQLECYDITDDNEGRGDEDEIHSYFVLEQDRRRPDDLKDLKVHKQKAIDKPNMKERAGRNHIVRSLIWEGELMPGQQVSFLYTVVEEDDEDEKDNVELSTVSRALDDIQREWSAKVVGMFNPIAGLPAADLYAWSDKHYLTLNPTSWMLRGFAALGQNDHVGTFFVTVAMGTDRQMAATIKPVRHAAFDGDALWLRRNETFLAYSYAAKVYVNNKLLGPSQILPFN